MISPRSYILGILMLFLGLVAKAQCPENIGFDFGSFKNWEGAKGVANTADGSLNFTQPGIFSDVHTLFYAKDNQIDPYGKFPIVSPNGSSTCVRLGNNTVGTNKAQQLTYTFTIPVNDPDYSIIYYYAVVFQNPNHQVYQQPRFTAKVFDVTDNHYITCGNFDFVASSNLPGFQNVGDVYYKDWSPVTINLLGFSGKTLRLEFATNNCTLGGHFGYAYLDVNQNCTSPVSGNTYCSNNPGVANLVAPSGFQAYYWYQGNDFSHVIGNASTLTVNPAPAIGTSYAVRIVPYPGIGCEDTIYTAIKATEPIVFKVKDTIATCSANGVDLTDTALTTGSNSDFTYTYFSDAACTQGIIGPQSITTSGTYYIQATTPGGCSVVKPVHIFAFSAASLVTTNPQAVCKSGLVDITVPAVTAGSDPGLTFTYWTDIAATQKLLNPKAIGVAGTYYIKATNNGTCSVVKSVLVTIVDPPKLIVNDPAGCLTVDMTLPAVTAGSDAGLTLTYWLDALTTQPFNAPTNITASNTYYIKATNSTGCTTIAPVNVDVKPVPVATITNPAAVVFPETVDLSTTFTPQSGLTYTYWRDAAATISLTNPNSVTRQATYYIKVSNTGCSTIYPVTVTIGRPPDIDFSPNVFTPNGDGVNDVFKFKAPSSINLKSFKIYGSWGQLLFETTDLNKAWDGTYVGKPMPVGTYYWLFDAYDTYSNTTISKSGSISIIR